MGALKMRTELLNVGSLLAKEARGMEEQPLYRSTVFETEDTSDYDRANCGERYLYDRIEAPNRDCLGEAISRLEQGQDTAVFGAGMGAISAVFLALNRKGSHVVVNRAVYGETIEFLNDILTTYGVDVSYVDFESPEAVEQAVTERTTLIYTEVLTNPLLRVVDLDAVTALARRRGVLTVVDSTFTTPMLIRPLEHGADLVIHSLTKYFWRTQRHYGRLGYRQPGADQKGKADAGAFGKLHGTGFGLAGAAQSEDHGFACETADGECRGHCRGIGRRSTGALCELSGAGFPPAA